MGIQDAYTQLMYQLFELYDDREAANIADLVIEHVTGFKRIDRITNKKFPLNNTQQEMLQQHTTALLKHKPVQYVLHEAWFAGMQFYVDENVLIPRPETEELVAWIVQEHKTLHLQNVKILDIGTGSGCIPIALKKQLPTCDIHAADISKGALSTAQKNASTLHAAITFHEVDILDETSRNRLSKFDVVVSNPPYIKQSEEAAMHYNVLKYEPHLALFVPDEDALLFYKAIADFGLQHLTAGGKLFFEINEMLGASVKALLKQKGYSNVEIRKDMQGKDRMVKAILV